MIHPVNLGNHLTKDEMWTRSESLSSGQQAQPIKKWQCAYMADFSKVLEMLEKT